MTDNLKLRGSLIDLFETNLSNSNKFQTVFTKPMCITKTEYYIIKFKQNEFLFSNLFLKRNEHLLG